MQNTRSTLDALLEQNAVDDGTLDFHGVHGFLSALAIRPAEMTEIERNECIFDGTAKLSPDTAATLNQALNAIKIDIDRAFNDEDGFTLSCESDLDNPDDDELANWCTGFMVAHLFNEDAWFESNEQEVCELLLPIMLASGLFDDEEEFREIRKDQSLTEDMCSQIPEVLMELYLMFNSPEEKKAAQTSHRR